MAADANTFACVHPEFSFTLHVSCTVSGHLGGSTRTHSTAVDGVSCLLWGRRHLPHRTHCTPPRPYLHESCIPDTGLQQCCRLVCSLVIISRHFEPPVAPPWAWLSGWLVAALWCCCGRHWMAPSCPWNACRDVGLTLLRISCKSSMAFVELNHFFSCAYSPKTNSSMVYATCL